MIPVLVLSHGELAKELLNAACKIDPHLEDRSEALTIPWEVDSDIASETVKTRLAKIEAGEGVLVLTDMFGGSATNLALPFLNPGKIEVVTGVNLPMLVRLATLRDSGLSLHELAERIMAAGQKSIHVASDFLKSRRKKSEREERPK